MNYPRPLKIGRWRFSDAGQRSVWSDQCSRRPKTCTQPDSEQSSSSCSGKRLSCCVAEPSSGLGQNPNASRTLACQLSPAADKPPHALYSAMVESRMSAVAWTMRQRSVSHPAHRRDSRCKPNASTGFLLSATIGVGGMPSTWQGWLVLAAFVVLVFAGSSLFPPGTELGRYLYGLLVGVCWLKGEPPHWRWGNDERA
jgi:hypothetical protein